MTPDDDSLTVATLKEIATPYAVQLLAQGGYYPSAQSADTDAPSNTDYMLNTTVNTLIAGVLQRPHDSFSFMMGRLKRKDIADDFSVTREQVTQLMIHCHEFIPLKASKSVPDVA